MESNILRGVVIAKTSRIKCFLRSIININRDSINKIGSQDSFSNGACSHDVECNISVNGARIQIVISYVCAEEINAFDKMYRPTYIFISDDVQNMKGVKDYIVAIFKTIMTGDVGIKRKVIIIPCAYGLKYDGKDDKILDCQTTSDKSLWSKARGYKKIPEKDTLFNPNIYNEVTQNENFKGCTPNPYLMIQVPFIVLLTDNGVKDNSFNRGVFITKVADMFHAKKTVGNPNQKIESLSMILTEYYREFENMIVTSVLQSSSSFVPSVALSNNQSAKKIIQTGPFSSQLNPPPSSVAPTTNGQCEYSYTVNEISADRTDGILLTKTCNRTVETVVLPQDKTYIMNNNGTNMSLRVMFPPGQIEDVQISSPGNIVTYKVKDKFAMLWNIAKNQIEVGVAQPVDVQLPPSSSPTASSNEKVQENNPENKSVVADVKPNEIVISCNGANKKFIINDVYYYGLVTDKNNYVFKGHVQNKKGDNALKFKLNRDRKDAFLQIGKKSDEEILCGLKSYKDLEKSVPSKISEHSYNILSKSPEKVVIKYDDREKIFIPGKSYFWSINNGVINREHKYKLVKIIPVSDSDNYDIIFEKDRTSVTFNTGNKDHVLNKLFNFVDAESSPEGISKTSDATLSTASATAPPAADRNYLVVSCGDVDKTFTVGKFYSPNNEDDPKGVSKLMLISIKYNPSKSDYEFNFLGLRNNKITINASDTSTLCAMMESKDPTKLDTMLKEEKNINVECDGMQKTFQKGKTYYNVSSEDPELPFVLVDSADIGDGKRIFDFKNENSGQNIQPLFPDNSSRLCGITETPLETLENIKVNCKQGGVKNFTVGKYYYDLKENDSKEGTKEINKRRYLLKSIKLSTTKKKYNIMFAIEEKEAMIVGNDENARLCFFVEDNKYSRSVVESAAQTPPLRINTPNIQDLRPEVPVKVPVETISGMTFPEDSDSPISQTLATGVKIYTLPCHKGRQPRDYVIGNKYKNRQNGIIYTLIDVKGENLKNYVFTFSYKQLDGGIKKNNFSSSLLKDLNFLCGLEEIGKKKMEQPTMEEDIASAPVLIGAHVTCDGETKFFEIGKKYVNPDFENYARTLISVEPILGERGKFTFTFVKDPMIKNKSALILRSNDVSDSNKLCTFTEYKKSSVSASVANVKSPIPEKVEFIKTTVNPLSKESDKGAIMVPEPPSSAPNPEKKTEVLLERDGKKINLKVGAEYTIADTGGQFKRTIKSIEPIPEAPGEYIITLVKEANWGAESKKTEEILKTNIKYQLVRLFKLNDYVKKGGISKTKRQLKSNKTKKRVNRQKKKISIKRKMVNKKTRRK
jgi:hypothetical protein